MSGSEVDLHAVTEGTSGSGVAHGDALVAFAEAVVAGDDESLTRARAGVLDALGPEALVDAAAVAGNFQRMDRIADATGIPLDGALDVMSHDLRDALDLSRYASAANTPAAGASKRALGRVLRPLTTAGLKLFGAASRGR